ncbi:ADP-ribosylglycohydrolase family protein [bacterium]|nr:ADP-ribosylglycohydrolase family protein [bacterium]
MIGALLGDIVGSVYENNPTKSTEFILFSDHSHYTDESVLTLAVADSLVHFQGYQANLRKYAKAYADVPGGFGSNFKFWVYTGGQDPYNSMGIGPAARVSPIGWAFNDLNTTLTEAEKSARATHSHLEAIKGAIAIAHSIYLGRTGFPLLETKKLLSDSYGYNLSHYLDDLRTVQLFEQTAPEIVPRALVSVLEARTTEDAIRNAISLGCSSNTIASLAGAVAEAFFGVPDHLKQETLKRLPEPFLNIMAIFREQHTSQILLGA